VFLVPVYQEDAKEYYQINGCGPKLMNQPDPEVAREYTKTTTGWEEDIDWRYTYDYTDIISAIFTLGSTRKAEMWFRRREYKRTIVYDKKGNILSDTREPPASSEEGWSSWKRSGIFNTNAKGYGRANEDAGPTPPVTISINMPVDRPKKKGADKPGGMPESWVVQEVGKPADWDSGESNQEQTQPEVPIEDDSSTNVIPDQETVEDGKGTEESYEFRFYGIIEDENADYDIENDSDPHHIISAPGSFKRVARAVKGEFMSANTVRSIAKAGYIPHVDLNKGPTPEKGKLIGWNIVSSMWLASGEGVDNYWQGRVSRETKRMLDNGEYIKIRLTWTTYRLLMEPVYEQATQQ